MNLKKQGQTGIVTGAGGWRLRVADLPVLKKFTGGTTFQVDITGAPRPARQYAADVAWFDRRPDQATLYFGQLRLDKKKLRSVLQVAVAPTTAWRILSNSKDATLSMSAYLERAGVDALAATAFEEEPDQSVLVRANMMSIAQVHHDAVADFYNISPTQVRDMQKTGYIDIDPVVRVETSTALLVGLLNAMYAHESHFPKDDNEEL